MSVTERPAYDASLTDHGFEPLIAKGLTYPLGEYAPGYGDVFPIAEGVGWTRLPVPGLLKHINVVQTGWYFPFHLSWASILEVSALTLPAAAIAGFYPAREAARLVVTDALDYE